MRGADETSGSLFSYVDLEDRIPAQHPLRKIRQVVNDALASLDAEFEALYTAFGRPSIAPERLIRASLLQILFSIRCLAPNDRGNRIRCAGNAAFPNPLASLIYDANSRFLH